MSHPIRFSIVIPVLNDGQWLPRSIESVLAQDYPHWNLIVGDNASDADLGAIVNGFRDERIAHNRWTTRAGIHENFNRTTAIAGGDWVLPLGADDRLDPACLGTMAERIMTHQALGRPLAMVTAACRRVDALEQPAEGAYYGTQGVLAVEDGVYEPADWLLCNCGIGEPPWNIGSLAVARYVLTESGGLFRPEVGLCADNELVLRAGAYGDVSYIKQALMDYTVRSDSDAGGRFERALSRGDKQTPHGLAFLAGLQVHQARRNVTHRERAAIHKAIARSYLLRAGAHRFRRGGRGHFGALLDVGRAFQTSPAALFNDRNLARALAAVLAPLPLLNLGRRLAREKHDRLTLAVN